MKDSIVMDTPFAILNARKLSTDAEMQETKEHSEDKGYDFEIRDAQLMST